MNALSNATQAVQQVIPSFSQHPVCAGLDWGTFGLSVFSPTGKWLQRGAYRPFSQRVSLYYASQLPSYLLRSLHNYICKEYSSYRDALYEAFFDEKAFESGADFMSSPVVVDGIAFSISDSLSRLGKWAFSKVTNSIKPQLPADAAGIINRAKGQIESLNGNIRGLSYNDSQFTEKQKGNARQTIREQIKRILNERAIIQKTLEPVVETANQMLSKAGLQQIELPSCVSSFMQKLIDKTPSKATKSALTEALGRSIENVAKNSDVIQAINSLPLNSKMEFVDLNSGFITSLEATLKALNQVHKVTSPVWEAASRIVQTISKYSYLGASVFKQYTATQNLMKHNSNTWVNFNYFWNNLIGKSQFQNWKGPSASELSNVEKLYPEMCSKLRDQYSWYDKNLKIVRLSVVGGYYTDLINFLEKENYSRIEEIKLELVGYRLERLAECEAERHAATAKDEISKILNYNFDSPDDTRLNIKGDALWEASLKAPHRFDKGLGNTDFAWNASDLEVLKSIKEMFTILQSMGDNLKAFTQLQPNDLLENPRKVLELYQSLSRAHSLLNFYHRNSNLSQGPSSLNSYFVNQLSKSMEGTSTFLSYNFLSLISGLVYRQVSKMDAIYKLITKYNPYLVQGRLEQASSLELASFKWTLEMIFERNEKGVNILHETSDDEMNIQELVALLNGLYLKDVDSVFVSLSGSDGFDAIVSDSRKAELFYAQKILNLDSKECVNPGANLFLTRDEIEGTFPYYFKQLILNRIRLVDYIMTLCLTTRDLVDKVKNGDRLPLIRLHELNMLYYAYALETDELNGIIVSCRKFWVEHIIRPFKKFLNHDLTLTPQDLVEASKFVRQVQLKVFERYDVDPSRDQIGPLTEKEFYNEIREHYYSEETQ